MSSGNPINPKILKGALVVFESQLPGPIPNIIVFQYNSEQLSRSLTQNTSTSGSDNMGKAKEEAYRVQGPPTETITLSVEMDAADQLEEPQQHPLIATYGLHPALAALELLLYPPTSQVFIKNALALAGSAQICPADLPMVLFVWGPSRVVPVKLTSFSVTETAFDTRLNPIQAKVDLGLQVLTYNELKKSSIGYGVYVTNQIQKEVFAGMNLVNKAQELIGVPSF